MGLFDFLKAKKRVTGEDVPLPPPPPMAPSMAGGDIPDIYPQQMEMPKPEYYPKEEKPEYSAPEKPEYYAKTEKSEYYKKAEKPEYYAKTEKSEYEKPAAWESAPVFDRTIESEPEAPAAPQLRRTPGPSFISVDEYRKVMEHANKARARLFEAEELVRRLGELKVQEEKEFDKWRTQLEDIEKKLSYVDSVIAKAKA